MASMLRVSVESVTDGRDSAIVLCERCLQSEDAAWHITWRAVPFAR